MDFNVSNQSDFARHQVVDQQQQGIVAAAFNHPADWRAMSQIYWNYNHSTLPAVFHAGAMSARETAALEFLPMENFSWTEPEMGLYGRGQNVGGTVNLPPMSGTDALVHLIIPKYRGNREGLRIVGAGSEPTAVNPPAGISPQAVVANKARVKIEYSENGRVMEEEFCATHMIVQFPPVNNGWSTSYFTAWSLTSLCCFRAPAERFDALRETFLKIESSLEINPQWVQLVNQVSQMLLQNSKQIGDQLIDNGWKWIDMKGREIEETSARNWGQINRKWDEINERYKAPPPSFDPYGSTSDDSEYGSHEAFVDMIRDETTIHNPADPYNTKVSGNPEFVWVNELGKTHSTDDPNYDPNVGSNHTWTLAPKRRIGD